MEPDEIIHSKLLTLVYIKEDEPLRHYVDENLGEFLLALTDGRESLEDEEKTILAVLDREDLTQECKEKYITALSCRGEISELKLVRDQALWPALMRGHIEAALTNLTDYYFLPERGMDETLVNYINSYTSSLKLTANSLDMNYGEAKRLLADVIRCDDLEYHNLYGFGNNEQCKSSLQNPKPHV